LKIESIWKLNNISTYALVISADAVVDKPFWNIYRKQR
jgi:hypothetical protein